MNMALLSLTSSIVCFFAFVFYLIQSFRMKKTTKRVENWFENENSKVRKSFILGIGDKFDQSEFAQDLSIKLTRANLKLKPSEYAGTCLLLFLTMVFIGYHFMQLVFLLSLIVSYLVVWVGSKFFLNSRQNKRTELVNKQLPEICRMLSNSVKAGLTIPQGMEMVAREISEPAGPEFQTMVQQLQFGDDFEEVMTRFRDRVDSKDLMIFVSTILIQRKVGGNLAEILSLMAETLEERARVNKEVSTVTAESKFVSIILPVLPLAMALMMNLIIPGFLNPLFSLFGMILLAIFLAIQVASFLIIRQITKIRV
ncbi:MULTISPECIES: type II secretion system F family protein [Bacillaceae]|uniref:type II secretion system F family protein n=1 Tax=Bacillaceae TaxID=186817 RepID=UPI00047A1FB7|nr:MULTISPECIES: type II secretion system F family protein [Bacillaceae]UOE92262.1 type II secretion system F family protein [Alkalihalobacillus sp. LMS39]